jgi:hypothetical protein
MTPAFKGIVKDGVFKLRDGQRSQFLEYCQGLADGDYWLSLKKKYKPAVWKQYKYLYKVVYPMIADETGYTIEEVDGLMKSKFFVDYVETESIDLIGKHGVLDRFVWFKIKSKASDVTNTKELGDYIGEIKRWCLDFYGIRIPEPNEVDYE